MSRLTLAFILLLAMLSGRPVMADLLDEDLKYFELRDRLAQLKTWEDLCTVVDCDRFPKGYSTWKLGDEYYYFRVESTMPPPKPGQIDFRDFDSMSRYGFSEQDSQGRTTRSFTAGFQATHIRIRRCCKWLLDQVGLLDQWPGFGRSRDTASLDLVWAKRYNGQDRNAELFPENPDGTKQQTLEHADTSRWISLNDDFWLIEFGKEINDSPDPERRYRMVRILSKEPIFNGRYVNGYCNFVQTCDFNSVFFADEDNMLPGVQVWALAAYEYQARACDDPNPVLNCDVGLAFFDKLKPAFQTLELMFERMKLRPDDIDLR